MQDNLNGLTSTLPKFDEVLTTKTIMFSEDRIYVIRPWKTKDERNFLIKKATLPKNVQDDEDRVKELLINDLVLPCIVEGKKEELSLNEIKKIMLELRCISVGEEVEGISFKCHSCAGHNTFNQVVDDNLLKFKPFDTSIQNITPDLKVKFKAIPYVKVSTRANEMDYLYNSVDEIIYKEKAYKSFSKKDFEEFFDALDLKTTKSMLTKLKDCVDGLDMVRTIRCVKCGVENSIDFGEIPNFFVP